MENRSIPDAAALSRKHAERDEHYRKQQEMRAYFALENELAGLLDEWDSATNKYLVVDGRKFGVFYDKLVAAGYYVHFTDRRGQMEISFK